MRLVKIFCILFLLSLTLDAQDYFQQDVSYDIRITLDPESKTYQGTEVLTYKNNSAETLDFIRIHLYPNAYKDETTPFARQEAFRRNREFHFSEPSERGHIDLLSVKTNDADLNWEYKPDAIDEIKIMLPEPLKPGAAIAIRFEFTAKFPKVFSRMGYFGSSYFAATQWYPKAVVFDKFGWHPDSYLDMGEFYGEFGNYDVSITLPKNFVIDATGMLAGNPEEEKINQSISDSTKKVLAMPAKKDRDRFIKKWKKERKYTSSDSLTKTVRFVAENVHDFAWFAGAQYMLLQSEHNDGILTNVLIQPDNLWDWRNVPEYVERTIHFYGNQIGPYQYPKASVVDGALEAGGGMEYPMITNVSSPGVEWARVLELVVMHEVGHNWFYGMLGNNERRDAFLDEGLNSFYEDKYMHHYYGKHNLTDFSKLLKGFNFLDDVGEWHLHHLSYGMTVNERNGQPLDLRPEEYSPNNYGSIVYFKSVMLLQALEWYLGEDQFRRGIRTYFARWNGRHPTREDFFAAMEEVSGEELGWFFDEWYFGTGYNDFKLSSHKKEKNGNSFRTTVYVKNNGTMKNMPAPVHLITTGGDTVEGRWEGKDETPVVIEHESPVERIEVNLKRDIFESNYLNNSSFPDVDLNLIGQFPKFDTYAINILPYYWYEYFTDKNRVGMGFWAGNPFFNHYFSHGSVYYGTGSGNIGYDYNLSNRYGSFFSNYIDATARINDMDGLKRLSFELKSVNLNSADPRYNFVFKLSFDHLKLHDMRYNESSIFEKSRYSVIGLTFYNTFRRQLYRFKTQFDLERAIDVFDSQTDYTKAQFGFFYKRYLTKKSELIFRMYGAGLWGSDIPAQELIYTAGEVDPKHNKFAPGRRGSIGPLRGWTFGTGMNMPGYADSDNPHRSGKTAASVRMEFKRSPYPAIYAAAGTAGNSFDTFGGKLIAEYGAIYGDETLQFVFPLYITDPAPGEKHLAFRFLFRFRVPLNISY